MEHGTFEREIFVEASPEIVFDVVSKPEHIKQWWSDDARFEPAAGSTGEVIFGNPDDGGMAVPLTVVDAQPPRIFSFRWVHTAGQDAAEGNSLLVTFDLTPSGDGTLLRMTESGYREMGWELAVLDEKHKEHAGAWNHFLPRLASYVSSLKVRS